jgi:hypothetical protein
MSQTKSIAIVADSFAGHLLASLFELSNHKVTLISTANSSVLQLSFANSFNNRIMSVPATPEISSALAMLQPYYTEKIILSEYEAAPVRFEGGAPIPFVGFGESKAESISALTQLHFIKFYDLNPLFLTHLEGLESETQILEHCEMTALHFADSKLEKMTINGSQDIYADEFIFLIPPQDYLHLLPAEYLSNKTRSRISKSANWTRMSLRFDHTRIHFDSRSLVFLNTTSPDAEPCVGQFYQPTSSNLFSIWETYVDKNRGEDPEYLAATIKNMRRAIKKAFPDMSADAKDTIHVFPRDAGDLGWILTSREMSEVAINLVISPSLAHPLLGLSRCIVGAASTFNLLNNKSLAQYKADVHTSLLESASTN